MEISEAQEKFVRRWGEMGVRWGIGRSTALIHGLLYVVGEAMTAEEMSEALGLARSNISTGLKELEGYGLVYKESRSGDRKTYYTAEGDVWEIARRILEERRRRETQGAMRAVEDCLSEAEATGDKETAKKMRAMKELLDAAENFAKASQKYPTSVFRRALKMGSKVLHWISQ